MKNRQMIKHLGENMPFLRTSYMKAVLLQSEEAAHGIFFRKRRKQHTTDTISVLRNFVEFTQYVEITYFLQLKKKKMLLFLWSLESLFSINKGIGKFIFSSLLLHCV